MPGVVSVWDERTKIRGQILHSHSGRGKSQCLSLKGSQAGRILSCWEKGQSFCSIQAFNWLNEAHPHYGRHCVLFQVHWFRANLIQKHLYRNIRNDFLTHVFLYDGPAKLTHRINYHSGHSRGRRAKAQRGWLIFSRSPSKLVVNGGGPAVRKAWI
jgi:hypothetical protein